MTPNCKAAVIIPIYGVFFDKTIGNLKPRGDHIYGYPHYFAITLSINFEQKHHALSWMYFCGYFALSNGQN